MKKWTYSLFFLTLWTSLWITGCASGRPVRSIDITELDYPAEMAVVSRGAVGMEIHYRGAG